MQKPWTENLKKNYTWLYNYIKTIFTDANLDNYIETFKGHLLSIISNNKAWSDGSKQALFFMVSRYLFNINDDEYKTFQEAGYKLKVISDENEDNNILDEKEKLYYKPYGFYVDVLENIDISKILTTIEHYKYLLLCCLIYQAPLRTSFYNSAKFITNISENDGINNFILIVTSKNINKVFYIVNKDKATNYKKYTNKNLSKIEVSNKLSGIINTSYFKHPSAYLFEMNKKPVTQNTLLNWLRDITNISGINIDMIRSAYITKFYEDNKTTGARNKLSNIMRHSATSASKYYNKVFNGENGPINTLNNKYNKIEDNETILKDENIEDIRHYKKKEVIFYII